MPKKFSKHKFTLKDIPVSNIWQQLAMWVNPEHKKLQKMVRYGGPTTIWCNEILKSSLELLPSAHSWFFSRIIVSTYHMLPTSVVSPMLAVLPVMSFYLCMPKSYFCLKTFWFLQVKAISHFSELTGVPYLYLHLCGSHHKNVIY